MYFDRLSTVSAILRPIVHKKITYRWSDEWGMEKIAFAGDNSSN